MQAQKKEETFLLLLAVRTGLEPATPCVTGMYSNQLNYRTNFYFKIASFSKPVAKVLLFFELTKFLAKKSENSCIFVQLTCQKQEKHVVKHIFMANYLVGM